MSDRYMPQKMTGRGREYFSFGAAGLLVIAAVLYNALLAVINGYGLSIGSAHVALTELLILVCAMGLIAMRLGAFENILPPVVFVLFSFMIFLFVSFVNESFFPKSFRDMLLIAVFFMVGGLSNERQLINVFRFLTLVILAFMIVENYFTDLYVAIFKPAVYYANTRGVEELSVDTTGLFRNSLGFGDRFSFGFLSTHRLSSIFLEQVSFANFAIILALFTSAFWNSIKRWDRVLFIATAVLMVLTNSSRTASLLLVVIFTGYFVFPHLPRLANFIYMPLILFLSAIFFYDPRFVHGRMSDDIKGRFGNTMDFLSRADTAYLFGGSSRAINMTGDSGYAYLVFTQTIFGILSFWIFSSIMVPQGDAQGKRFANGMAIYIAFNLMIGAAIFSIKVSAPLWFIAGYLYYSKFRTPPESA